MRDLFRRVIHVVHEDGILGIHLDYQPNDFEVFAWADGVAIQLNFECHCIRWLYTLS